MSESRKIPVTSRLSVANAKWLADRAKCLGWSRSQTIDWLVTSMREVEEYSRLGGKGGGGKGG